MKGLLAEIRTAERRYAVGQLVSFFLLGTLCGGILGWYLWG